MNKMNKRVGILTFHNVDNVGANLQAFCLQDFITRQILDCEIINFYPNNFKKKKSWKRKILSLIKKVVCPTSWIMKMRSNKFESFRNSYYKISKEKYYGDNDAINLDEKYSALISGSDQIFSTSLSGNSITYYLPFANCTKISYGSSFGKDYLSDFEAYCVLKYLPSFKHVSFRENDGLIIVNNLLNSNISNLVVDPVFLKSKDEWMQLCSKHYKKNNYILVYAVEESNALINTIRSIKAKYKNYPVIILSNQIGNLWKYGKVKNIFGPIDFLNYINGAKCVITNSFHGFAFSIIFQKELYQCHHSTRNSRILSLARLINSEDLIIKSDAFEFQAINTVDRSKLTNQIKISKKYLFSCLGGKK